MTKREYRKRIQQNMVHVKMDGFMMHYKLSKSWMLPKPKKYPKRKPMRFGWFIPGTGMMFPVETKAQNWKRFKK